MEQLMNPMCMFAAEELFFDQTFSNLYNNWVQSHDSVVLFVRHHSVQPKSWLLQTESWLLDYEKHQFFQLFRMNQQTVGILTTQLIKTDDKMLLSRPYTGGHQPVETKLQVLVFLWYMATQDSLVNMGNRFKMSPATVMKIVNVLLYLVLGMKTKCIKFPCTEVELQDVADGFKKYPGVVGAVDGSHIFIKVPKQHHESYIDRYKRHSINLMSICDSKTMFLYIYVGFPGSAHDSRVLENSQLLRTIERNGPSSVFGDGPTYHLIGDSAFKFRTWLMTPYRDNGHLTPLQKYNNYCLSSDRVCIENAFGSIKGRWRRTTYIDVLKQLKL